MRKAYSNQLRFDSVPIGCVMIESVQLNLSCRDSIVPVLRALQHVYCKRELTNGILDLIAADINQNSRTDTGRKGMDCWGEGLGMRGKGETNSLPFRRQRNLRMMPKVVLSIS